MALLNCVRDWLTAIFGAPLRLLRTLLPSIIARGLPANKKPKMPKTYEDDEAWADVAPIPQDDGGLHPLAAIAYSEEYSEAMGYLDRKSVV